jgi:uncharacterized protein
MQTPRIPCPRLSPLIALLVLAGIWAQADARVLFSDPEDLVVVELATVGVNSLTGTPVVVLREPASGDVVPIVIGPIEARAILMALQEVTAPRPMTHDLISNILAATGLRLERVLVDALIDGTYHGALDLRANDSETPIYVDTRPSDSLALAVREGAAIFVSPEVIEAARGLDFEPLPDQEIVTALGITVVALTDDLRMAMEFGDRAGVLVSRATGAAARAGLAAGALIVSVNGETPESPLDFLDLVRRTPAGEKARIVFWDDGEQHEIELSTDVPDIHRFREAEPRLQV